jgi:hypothetical protein
MRGASGIGMGTTIKHLRCTTSGAAGNGLGATMKYLLRTTSAAANNGMSTTIIPPCSAASFVVNSEPHTGARPSVRLCVGPELARCVHKPTSKKKASRRAIKKINGEFYNRYFWKQLFSCHRCEFELVSEALSILLCATKTITNLTIRKS